MIIEEEIIDSKIKAKDAFKTIGEVADILDLPQHVIRFWEGKFAQINPVKNNNRRYYSKEDLDLLIKIKTLLYVEGYTIKGVQNFLTQDTPQLGVENEAMLLDLLNNLKRLKAKLELHI